MHAVAAAALFLAGVCLGAQNSLRVTNARELVQAIGSNRTVLLAPGEYLLTEAAPLSNPVVSWEPEFDGPQIVIRGVSNLTLRAPKGVTLLASPRYAFTLFFVDCRNLALEGLTLGHTEAGECAGGVLYLYTCADVRVEGCDLFGSGTVGISATDCFGITVRASTIRHCTRGALWALAVQGLRLEKVSIIENESWPLLSLDSSPGANFDSCRIEFNTGGELLWLQNSEQVSLPSTEITRNKIIRFLSEGSERPNLTGTRFIDNLFPDTDAELGEPWYLEEGMPEISPQ